MDYAAEKRKQEIEMDKEFGGGHLRRDRCERCKGYGFNIVFGCPTDCSKCGGTGRQCNR